MSNQGTIRLKVTNGAPAIEKLWNGRFKLEFFCDNNSPKEDWYYDNIGAILPDYGILQEANFGSGVSEDWEAIPSSVYPDMRLVLAEYPYNVRAGKHYVKLTYETLTASWVEEKDEDTDYELNGLKRVSRTFVALPDTAYDKVVGTSTIDSNGTTLHLGSFKIKETDAKWSLSEIWLEAGELSREENLEDARGSISITQIGGCPAAPTGYTVVNESKNNTQGFETCSRTFYKDGSVLSRSNDYVGSQLAENIEVFSPTSEPTPTNGTAVLGNKSTSNVDGIPTTRYTFLVPSVLSESSDKVGSQLAITIEAFNETPATPTGYVIASEQASDVEGIPTTRYTFLKPSVLSRSEDKVGSQLAIAVEAFNEVPVTPSGYVIANKQTSDVEGITTTRYTFLKPSVLSESTDNVGSQQAKVIEAFSEIPTTPSGYSLASTQVSDFEGIKTNRYTFLENNVVLSESEDKVGSQMSITKEVFNGTPVTPSGYSLANEQVSDVGGIPTKRFTFLKPSILSVSRDLASPDGVTRVVAFLITEAEALIELGLDATHVLVDSSESDYEGLKTSSYIFSKTASVDIIDFDLNGLMRVTTTTRDQSTPLFGQDIGVSSRTVNGTVVYLAQLNIISAIKNEETYVWIEAGIADESESIVGDGLRQVDRISFKYENAPSVGVVVFKKQTNYNGYPMWNTSTIQLFDGSAPDSAVASSYSSFVPFTYPGVASLVGFPNAAIILEAPVTAEIEATIQISYQTSNSIGSLDHPLWSPIEWAYLQSSWTEQESWTTPDPGSRSYGYSRGGSKNQALPGYRSGTNSFLSDSASSGPISVFGQALLNRTKAFADSSSANATITANLTGGPEDPIGRTYTIQTPVLEEAFADIGGTKYYRKTLITSTIAAIGGQSSMGFNGVTIENGDSNPTAAKGTSFGAVPVGNSVTRTFQVTNTGVSDLVLGSPSVSSNQFAVSGLNTTVSPGSTSALTVTYTAISGSPGLRTGAISYDQGISGSFTFAIDWISEL